MDILNEAERLKGNRLMRTNEEFLSFEDSSSNIMSFLKIEYMKYLFEGFHDETEHFEVMYGLVHGVEHFITLVEKDTYWEHFVKCIPLLLPHAKEWAVTLQMRILGSNEYTESYVSFLKSYHGTEKEVVLELMNHIRNNKKKGNAATNFIHQLNGREE